MKFSSFIFLIIIIILLLCLLCEVEIFCNFTHTPCNWAKSIDGARVCNSIAAADETKKQKQNKKQSYTIYYLEKRFVARYASFHSCVWLLFIFISFLFKEKLRRFIDSNKEIATYSSDFIEREKKLHTQTHTKSEK